MLLIVMSIINRMSSPLISVDRQRLKGAREGDTGGGGDVYGKVGWRYSVVAHERPHTNGRRMEFAVPPDRPRLQLSPAVGDRKSVV